MNQFEPKNEQGDKCDDCAWYQASQETLKENMQSRSEAWDRLDNGRDYLMTVNANEITVEDALEAFGFGRDGHGA